MEDWQDTVVQELQTRGWTLVPPHPDFVLQVRAELLLHHAAPEAAPTLAIQRATVRCYARVLFASYGADGTPAQQQAFLELRTYLFKRAIFRLHDRIQADDATQQALVKIYQKRTLCRDAGSFLRWCEQVMNRLIMDEHRELYAERLSERGVEYVAHEVGFHDPGDTVNEDSNPREDAVPDPTQDTPHAAMTEPMRAAMLAALRECLENDRHAAVIGELFINDKTFSEVAEQLHISPLNVQVIRSRAIKKLRDCPNMQQLVEDWNY